jgi:hypothetical protein
MSEHPDGVRRDAVAGKPRFDLMYPESVPYEDQLITRVARLYERGAAKYGDRNWEKSETKDSLAHHVASFWRHATQFILGVDDGEDHAAAVVFNVNAILLTRRNIKRDPVRPQELHDLVIAVTDCEGDTWKHSGFGTKWTHKMLGCEFNLEWSHVLRRWGPLTSADGKIRFHKDGTAERINRGG